MNYEFSQMAWALEPLIQKMGTNVFKERGAQLYRARVTGSQKF
jgi:hypothetical protein